MKDKSLNLKSRYIRYSLAQQHGTHAVYLHLKSRLKKCYNSEIAWPAHKADHKVPDPIQLFSTLY